MAEPPISKDVAEIEQTLGRVMLFAHLTPRQRARLARFATTRDYKEGSTIVRQGDTSMSLYVVLSGSVRVNRESEGGGGAVEVEQLARGGAFGEMGLIEDLPRAATVVAVEPTTCALLAKWDFQNELRDDPEIALSLLPVLTGRIRELDSLLAQAQGER
ncbi:MAG TPA: cyclic nucleotide-binding domain-containing protein [Gaiellaceae bacterium]|nr:cyclic nucleotide-binding domain-containing protein [Gaiellaceae bacterium]